MTKQDIRELMSILKNIQENDVKPKDVEKRCSYFCKKHKINITHGSAFKELRHKSYYYKNKYVQNLLTNHTDLYGLRRYNLISDKEIVDRIFKQ